MSVPLYSIDDDLLPYPPLHPFRRLIIVMCGGEPVSGRCPDSWGIRGGWRTHRSTSGAIRGSGRMLSGAEPAAPAHGGEP